jgi:hypothetical protein
VTNAAVLVNLTIGSFSNERTDQQATKDVAKMYNANSKAGRYVRKRLPDEVLTHIQSLQREMRKYHYTVTAPWFDGGIRIMAGKMIVRYRKEFKRIDSLIQIAVEELVASLPKIIADAQSNRGKLFHVSDFPSPNDLRHAFRLDAEILPVPLEGDFRTDYASNKVRKKLSERNKARFEGQTRYVKSQFIELLERLEGNLKYDNPKIRVSTITQFTWLRQNMAELLLDPTELPALKETLAPIDQVIVQEFDEDARPKFNPLAIEEARVVVTEALEKLR